MSPIISPSGGGGASVPQQLDYVEFTAPVAISATTVGTANVIVTGSSVAYDGSTAVLIAFFCPDFRGPNTTTPTISVGLFEDGTQLGVLANVSSSAAVNWETPMNVERRMTPSNASHVYSIRAYGSAATGASQANAGAGGVGAGVLMPGFIRISRAL